ncbi:MAG: DUF1638 domain-containing protein [Actinomycetota bacterium]
MDRQRVKVIACATVIEEMLPLMRPGMTHQEFHFGLHLVPDELRRQLQEAIDSSSREADVIVLGYGLCSMAAVGLKATDCTLVIPKVDDCIALFLGSRASYDSQSRTEPGTYYLTKGWIEVGDSPFQEYERLVEHYGREKADAIVEMMLGNYTRVVYIDTGVRDQDRYREFARRAGERFNLRYEEIPGSHALIEKMINGPWDEEFVVAQPGQTISFADFKRG